MLLSGLSSNLWKYFLIQFTNRRNYIPILSIYYLTFPNIEYQSIVSRVEGVHFLSLGFSKIDYHEFQQLDRLIIERYEISSSIAEYFSIERYFAKVKKEI